MEAYQDDEIIGKAYDSKLMKRLLAYVRPYRWQVAGAISLTVAISSLGPVRPYLTKVAVDEYITTGDYHGLFMIAGLIVLTLLVQSGIHYFAMYYTQWIGQHIVYDMRMQVFAKLQNLALSFFDKNPLGRLITRVTGDVEVLNEMFSSGLVTVFADVFVLTWIIAFMFFISWPLALVTLSILPLLVYGTFLFRKKVREAYRDVRKQVARLNAFLQERISGILTVQLMGREHREYQRYRKINRGHADAHIRSVFYYAIFYPSVELFSAVSIGLIVWYGGGQIVQGALTLGVLISFIQYTEMFFRPIRDLSEKYNIMQSAMASSERIFQLLDDDTVVPDTGTRNDTQIFRGDVVIENLSFAYKRGEDVLRDVSMTIPHGSTVAIVGATGAGKTTIISLLTRFYDFDRGRILIGGTDIKDIPVSLLRRHIGVVMQDVFLFSGTIAENIHLGNPEISEEDVRNAAEIVGADRFIRQLEGGYDAEVKERGAMLSVGQKQLLSFARALAFNPEILILDEATASIDTETEQMIQRAIEELLKGRTSIVIAHRLSTIQNADKIIVLHKGKIREEGTHKELLQKKGIYYRLYQLQYKDQELRAA